MQLLFVHLVANLSGAVHKILLPVMKEIKDDWNSVKDDLNSLKNDLSSFNDAMKNFSVKVSNLENYQTQLASTFNSKLDSINASMREELRAIDSILEEHQTLTTSLAGLQSNVTSELTGLHITLRYNSQQLTLLSNDVDTLDSKLYLVNVSMREEHRAMECQLDEHQTQTTLELAGLQSNLTSELTGLHISLQSNIDQLTQLSTNVDTLDSKLDSVNASIRKGLTDSLLRTIEGQFEALITSKLAELWSNVTSELHTINSKLDSVNSSGLSITEDLTCIKQDLSSFNETMNGISDHVEEHNTRTTIELMNLDQNLQQNFTLQLKNLFDYIAVYTCGDTGGWRRVVYLDMAENTTNCPCGWQLTSYPKRACSRVSIGTLTCDSVTFPVSGRDYTRVCGRIIGYQVGHTDGFQAYNAGDGDVTTIDGAYVTGVSLTHGSPRQHIWTFAAGSTENDYTDYDACPCDATINITIPPFVGGDYFCESGVNSGNYEGFHPDDPLWDGQNCTASSTCCSFNNPPYFTKQLSSPTTDDLEARICSSWDGTAEDTPLELIELYVQ